MEIMKSRGRAGGRRWVKLLAVLFFAAVVLLNVRVHRNSVAAAVVEADAPPLSNAVLLRRGRAATRGAAGAAAAAAAAPPLRGASAAKAAAALRRARDPLRFAKRCFGLAHRNARQRLSGLRIARLRYPDDAAAHHFELMQATQRFRSVKMHGHAGYDGPWVENVWISTFAQRPLAEFYPYIPLFVPWTDVWKAGATSYKDLAALLGGLLRPNVAYVTVSQNARGIPANMLARWSIPNVLVFSAGGYGHVPIPLLKRELSLMPLPRLPLPADAPLVAFAGSKRRGVRPAAIAALKRAIKPAGGTLLVYKGKEWQRVLASARFALVPRGFGRTTFMVAEALQMGLIPIYVYDDAEWLPYRGSGGAAEWSRFGFSMKLTNISLAAASLPEITDEALAAMRTAVRAVRESHFTYDGVMEQIIGFIRNGTAGSDLRCAEFPTTTT